MSLTEQKKKMDELLRRLETKLSESFEQIQIREKLCFRKTDGVIFALSKFPGEMAVVIEYAESYNDATLYRFEDGDRFYSKDMDEETMYQAMLVEING